MIHPLPQSENTRKCDRVMHCTKFLTAPKLKNATLFIGYLNVVICILFIIVTSASLANWYDLFEGSPPYADLYYFANNVVAPSVLTIAIICLGFTVALIAGTHMEKMLLMRIYFSFGVIGLLLSVVIMTVIVFITAFIGELTSMIFAMQIFFFFGVYVVQLYVIQLTIEHFENPIAHITQETHVKDEKDTSLPPYLRYEYSPRLTVAP